MDRQTLIEWLEGYKEAWETRDADVAVALFAENAHYHWDAFNAPLAGRAAIRAAWEEATSDQRDVSFRYRVVAVEGEVGVNQWRTTYTLAGSGTQLEYDGVFVVTLNEEGLCTCFKEWWTEQVVEAPGQMAV